MTGPPLLSVSLRARHVWRRNADVFRTTWLMSFLPPLMEPVLYVLAFGYGIGGLVGSVTYQGRPVSYLAFIAPGVLAVSIMFSSYFETTYSTFVRMYYQRTFDAIVATPLSVEDVIAGEWIWGATKSVISATLMLTMLAVMGLATLPSALWVLPLAVGGGLLFSALGLVTTALVPKIDAFNLPIFLLVMPMFLFGGTFFPLDGLPGWAMAIAMALPLTHLGILVRGACLGSAPPAWPASVAYLALLSLPVFWLGLVLMRRRLVK